MASSTSTIIGQKEQAKEKNIAEETTNRTINIREDDYNWRKYGKTYLARIKKYRSYYRCVNWNCNARKKVEWPPNEPDNIDIVYEGDHNHRALAAAPSKNEEEEQAKEKNMAEERNNRTITIREDDYKWRKYGEKYIIKVKKFRSYYRCLNINCNARKKLEWPLNEPDNIDIVYEGGHNHRAFAAAPSENEEVSPFSDHEEQAKEKNIAEERNNRTITIQEDDYNWRKYGKQYLAKIKKYRSYYRCVNKNCKARKKVDCPPNEPDNKDIVYEGDHNHRALAAAPSENEEAQNNQNDLAT